MMERRSFARYDSDLLLKFFYGSTMFSGSVINCSESGLCISTHSECLPLSYSVKMVLLIKNGVSIMAGKTARVSKVSDSEINIGVEIIDPPSNYISYVEGLHVNKNIVDFKPDNNNQYVQFPGFLYN